MAYNFGYDMESCVRSSTSAGKLLERYGIPTLSSTLSYTDKKTKKRISRIKETSKEQDLYEGTDMIYDDDLRLDLTTAFDTKDNMPYMFDTGIPAANGKNYMMGVRIGNTHKGHTDFPEPVIVFGVTMEPKEYYNHEDELLKSLHENAKQLISKAYDAIDDYQCTDMEERQELFDTPLQRNPKYKMPKKVKNNRYLEIEELRKEIDKNNTYIETYEVTS